jgi:hypothetical protein
VAKVHQVGKMPLSSMAANHPRIAAGRYFEEPTALLLSRAGTSPARLAVDCSQNAQRKFEEPRAELDVEFDVKRYDLDQLSATLDPRRLTECAAIGLALLFLPHLAEGAVTNVTKEHDRTDYWVDGDQRLLEVSGTRDPRRLRRRHAEKVARGSRNPHGLPYFVSVSCFGDLTSVFSFHEVT